MNRLRITDNHDWIDWDSSPLWTQSPSEVDQKNLSIIADVRISDLSLDGNPNLLVFPKDLKQYGDAIGDECIISLNKNQLSTGNIMGFVGVNDTQIDICSRFATEEKDYFLHYMLHKVFSISLFDIKHTTNEEQVFDFLLYLFPHFLKKALAQGVFKKYQKFEHNDANVKGPIDIARHIRENVPFRGTVCYSTREHSYDNEVTQLVRHTIEFIKNKAVGRHILNNDMETKSAVSQIVMATPSYQMQKRISVINDNLRPIRHPYFSEYTALQKLCLQILRHENIKFGQEKDKVYGILFDGAWLWEEYLSTILSKQGFKHPRNKESRGGIRMFMDPGIEDSFGKNSRRMYPDFYREDYILDAKYKHLDGSVGREDLYQVVSYMYCMKAAFGGFIYPNTASCEITKLKLAGFGNDYDSKDAGGILHVIPFAVPQSAGDWNDFIKRIQNSEDKLRKVSRFKV